MLGPGHQSTVLFTTPRSINHLFTQLEDYSCSFASSSLSCHGASQGRHRHSCIKVIGLLSPWQRTGWMGAPPPCSHQHPPTHKSSRLGVHHQHLRPYQPRLMVIADGWQTICRWVGQMYPAVALNRTLSLFLDDKIQSIVCLSGAC